MMYELEFSSKHKLFFVNLFEILLFCSHNTHHYIEYFRAIRQSIADDTLPELIELIKIQQKVHDICVGATEQIIDVENDQNDENRADLKKIKIDE